MSAPATMGRVAPALCVAAALLASVLLVASAVRHARAASDAAAAEAGLAALARDLREASALAAAPELVAVGRGRASDLSTLVRAALRDAGLSDSALRELAESSDAPLDAGGGLVRVAEDPLAGYRGQTVALTLDALRPADVGRFLSAWRARAPLWPVLRVELRHAPRRERDASGRGVVETDGLYQATLSVGTVYLPERAAETSPPGARSAGDTVGGS